MATLEQARDEHALEIFQNSYPPFSNPALFGLFEQMNVTDDLTSFGPGTLKSQGSGWLMETSGQSLHSLHSLHMYEGSQPHALVARPPSPLAEPSSRASHSPSPRVPPVTATPVPFSRLRSNSPERSFSPCQDISVEGQQFGARSRSNSPQAQESAIKAGTRERSEFAAALGLTWKADSSDFQVSGSRPYSRRVLSPKSSGSRPTSANSAAALRKARATITARPKSAALPAIQRLQRPPSEASLLKEAKRLLATPANPSSQLSRSASAPGVRSTGSSAAHGRQRRPQSGMHG